MAEILQSIESGWGLDLILWFQSWRTPVVAGIFAPFNYLGTEIGILVIIPLVYWCVNRSFGRRFIMISLFSTWLNLWTKNLWQRPRPFMVEGSPVVPVFDYHATYGLPSGHTMLAATSAGYTSWSYRRRWIIITAIVFTLLMGLSRLIHGVHFFQDVVTGLLLSAALVLIFGKLEEKVGGFFLSSSLFVQIMISLGLGLFQILIFALSPADTGGLKDCISLGSITAGSVCGIALEERFVGFSSSGTFPKRIFRYLTGFAGLFILYLGLRVPAYALTDRYPDAEVLSIVLRFIRYSSLGVWVMWGGPFVFVKTGLAEKK